MQTNTNHVSPLRIGARVHTPDGIGALIYATTDHWLGIRIDGERVVHEWPTARVTEVAS
jgi:hypothetical protein